MPTGKPVPVKWKDPLAGLTGAQRNAYTALHSTFKDYGLESLAPAIIAFLKQGFSADTISIKLQETREYKRRFAANEARIKRGLPALSPREYIETERAYRAVMRNSGMPAGFWDSNSDFQKHLENDLAPAELQERVESWKTYANDNATGIAELKRLYGMDAASAAAYAMDPTRALPLIQKQARAVTLAAAGRRHGFTISRGLAEQYAGGNYKISAEDAEKGFAAIQEVQPGTEKLASIYGDTYSVEDAAAEMFGGDATASKKRKKLASQERGTFSDSSRGKTGKSSGSNY